MKGYKLTYITFIIALMATIAIFIIWSVLGMSNVEKELDSLKFELTRVHNEVEAFTGEVAKKDQLKVVYNNE